MPEENATTTENREEHQTQDSSLDIDAGAQGDLENEVISAILGNLILYPILLLYFLITFIYVTSKVIPYQFIDEKFHVGQTLTYLQGDWFNWDPKITTPPGLYILGWLNYHIWRPFIKSWSDLTILRLVNFIGGMIIFPIFVLRKIFWLNAIASWPVTLMCFPLMATYYYLYYTDVWATIFILASLAVSLSANTSNLKRSMWLSSLLAGISCLFRQTNIVWTGFIMVIAVERSAIIQKQFNTHNFNNYLKLFIHSIDEFQTLVLPFAINFVLFFIYLVWNRSITLGDKSNHSAGLHLVQIFYCYTSVSYTHLANEIRS